MPEGVDPVMGQRLPDDKRSAIVADIRAGGKSCRAIGRAHGVSHAIVSRIAKEEGLSFDRAMVAQTAAATEAAQFDARATRAVLIQRSYTEAGLFLDRLRAPFVYAVTGQFGVEWVTVAQPPPREQQSVMTSFGIAVDKALTMEKHDSGAGIQTVVSLLDTLYAGLSGRYGTGDEEHPTAIEAAPDG